MVVTPVSRNLLIQLQIGQTTAGKPKLHNRVYPHVDVNASDTAIDSVLTALLALFSDPVFAVGRVDTVQLQNAASTGATSTGATSTGTTSTGTTSTGTTSTGGSTAASPV